MIQQVILLGVLHAWATKGVERMLEQRDGGCHCGRVRFRAQVDLDLLSQCSCSVCTKKGILHLPVALKNFELLKGKSALTRLRGLVPFLACHPL
ncbi:MAG TPA: hypothetical protein VGI22_24405 [Xanthobacteraceae bacterium]